MKTNKWEPIYPLEYILFKQRERGTHDPPLFF